MVLRYKGPDRCDSQWTDGLNAAFDLPLGALMTPCAWEVGR